MNQDLEYVRAMAMINARRARREAKMRREKDDYIVLHEGSVVMRGTLKECEKYAIAMDENGYTGQEIIEAEAFEEGMSLMEKTGMR